MEFLLVAFDGSDEKALDRGLKVREEMYILRSVLLKLTDK
jgi:hypothetical protein